MNRKIVIQIRCDQIELFLEPDDLQKLQKLGELELNPFERAFTQEELNSRLFDASVCISTWGSTPVTEEMLATANKLELFAHMAGSVKKVISAKAFDLGITVLSGAYAIAESVAESALALVLADAHRIKIVDAAMRSNVKWKSMELEADELRGKTVGLIALGMVARELIHLLRPFGVKFIAYDPYFPPEKAAELGVDLASLHQVIKDCQILSVHAPLTPETYHMLGRKEIRLIQDGCMLINTSRGSVFDESALIEELKTNRFSAALDVFEIEPLPMESELRRLPNVYVRPHLAGVNPSSRKRIGKRLVNDIESYFKGKTVSNSISKAQIAFM